MKCCMCNNEIAVEPISGWDLGNNAEPVVEDGRCCNDCNCEIVIPHRIIAWQMQQKEGAQDGN